MAGGGFDWRPFLSGRGGLLAGPANVVMQLAWPEVGYGVAESRVTSGSAVHHPFKRARTTFSYLAVATLGDDDDRTAFRRAVDRQHARVVSTGASPVWYRALDPELQLWVAACLCYGIFDLHGRMHGPLDDATADALYAASARLGTTLQVRPEMWPADRAAFARYWEASLARVAIDDTIRRHLMALVRLENLPRPLGSAFTRRSEFATRGFLPEPIREQMHLRWTAADERRFAAQLRRLGRSDDRFPEAVRIFPFNALLADVRRRVRSGRPLV